FVKSGGAAIGTTVNGVGDPFGFNGGLIVESGGTATNTIIAGGELDVHGSASGTQINGNGQELVFGGGQVTDTTVNNGTEYVSGQTTNSTLNAGGREVVQ